MDFKKNEAIKNDDAKKQYERKLNEMFMQRYNCNGLHGYHMAIYCDICRQRYANSKLWAIFGF